MFSSYNNALCDSSNLFFTPINPGDMGPLDIIRKVCIKSNIRYTDELPYISQMSAIGVNDYVKHFNFN